MSLKSVLILNDKIDSVDTPEAGKIHLFLNGNTLKYKNSAGTEFVLATGVSQEEVEDIVANLLTEGNGININYDDPNNQLIIAVNESQINHQNLIGAGTNTHAQIDNHIASTSNPHGVTFSQVGADPAGSASNAQSFSIQRSNHTGTQLASTISDLASSVRSTILTGISFVTSSAVLATDTILEAIGKLQTQVNNLTALLTTLMIGDNFEEFLDDTPFSTNSGSNQTAVSFSTASKQACKYRIGIKWNFTLNSTTNSVIFGVYLDGALLDGEIQVEIKDATDDVTYYSFYYVNLPITQTHILELRTRMENGSTVTVSRCRAEIWRAN